MLDSNLFLTKTKVPWFLRYSLCEGRFHLTSVSIFRVARLSLIVLFAQEALEEVVKLDADNSER